MARIIKSSEAVSSMFTSYECGMLGLGVVDTFVEDESGSSEAVNLFPEADIDAERRLEEVYSEGLRRGFEAGKAEYEAAVAESAQALRGAAEAMREARETFLASLEPQVLELVEAVTARILHHEASVNPAVVQETVRTALRSISEREHLTVLLNPRDLRAIREQQIDCLDGLEGLGSVELVADESVGIGGCVVESDTVRVDARLEKQLERILGKLVGQAGV